MSGRWRDLVKLLGKSPRLYIYDLIQPFHQQLAQIPDIPIPPGISICPDRDWPDAGRRSPRSTSERDGWDCVMKRSVRGRMTSLLVSLIPFFDESASLPYSLHQTQQEYPRKIRPVLTAGNPCRIGSGTNAVRLRSGSHA